MMMALSGFREKAGCEMTITVTGTDGGNKGTLGPAAQTCQLVSQYRAN